jgi:hypothetical protein
LQGPQAQLYAGAADISALSLPRPNVGTSRYHVPKIATQAIKDYASTNIGPGARVVSEGLACFGGVVEAGMNGGRRRWTNTGLGNIKSAIIGTCRSCDPQHTERYLAAFEYRFNRRFELDKMVERSSASQRKLRRPLPINRCREDPSGEPG